MEVKGLQGSRTYCDLHSHRPCVPGAEIKGELAMAWTLGGPRKSPEAVPGCTGPWPVPILRELDLTDLSEHVAAKVSLITHGHPELFSSSEWPGMYVNTCRINLHDSRPKSWAASQEYRPNGSLLLHRTAQLYFSAHRKRVLTSHSHLQQPQRSDT